MKFVLALSLTFVCCGLPASTQTSMIDVPVSVSLRAVEDIANSSFPVRIVSRSEGRTCVEPQKACTKVPEFRGLKVTMKNRCIETTPRIDCTIDERVDRVGALRLTGEADTLSISQRLDGSATVRGRGEIGRHIRETAEAEATLTVTLRPQLNRDWTVGLRERPDFSVDWHSTPRARLFNLFDVTFQRDADRAMRDAFNSVDFQGALNRIDLKSDVALLWKGLQEPVEVEAPWGKQLYLAFRPEGVSIDALSFDANEVRTGLALSGQFSVSDEIEDADPVPLPELSDNASEGSGLDIAVPLSFSMEQLTEMANAGLPAIETFDLLGHSVDIKLVSVEIKPTDEEDRIGARIMVIIPTPLGDSEVPFELTGRPVWDNESRFFSLAEPEIRSDPGIGARQVIDAFLSREDTRQWIAAKTVLGLSQDIEVLEASVNGALSGELVRGLKTKANLIFTLSQIRIDQNLDLVARATGPFEVEILTLN
ncbi:DUF4403 family protein [Roseobacter sp. S98]|uniref:DUF4403 family protein n=1 Tax=Roseobacter algicola (ex Choi et al. 2025) (nom. illeg.) TaxID=3092138 RepID=UPI003F5124B4